MLITLMLSHLKIFTRIKLKGVCCVVLEQLRFCVQENKTFIAI